MIGKYTVIQIVQDIKAEADELLEKSERTDMDFGQLLAYAESLCIIRDACAGYDLAKLGLDFDIDKKYLL